MAYPSPQAVAAIRAKVADWSPANTTIAANLNTPSVANPAPQGVVRKPFVAADLVNACSAASRPNLTAMLNGSAAMLIAVQDSPHLNHGLDAMQVIGSLTAADVTAMKAAMTPQTQPDPNWPAQISWAVANLGRPVDTDDIAASRPGV